MMECLKGLLLFVYSFFMLSSIVQWLLTGSCLLCTQSTLMSHREPYFYSSSNANYIWLWLKNISIINIFISFHKNLVKSCAPCGRFINSWVVTDYSNWIHLKLIILSWSFFLWVDNKASLLQFVAGCYSIYMHSAPWRSPIHANWW